MNFSKIMLSGILAVSVSAPAFSSKVYDENASEGNIDGLSAELVINKRPRLYDMSVNAAAVMPAKRTDSKARKISEAENTAAEADNNDLSPHRIVTADTYFAAKLLMQLRQDEW